jgi:hypothetical protein
MSFVNGLILRIQLAAMRKDHPEMASDIKSYLALGHDPAQAIRLATIDQAKRLKSTEPPSA